jgi:hypothetical protein
MEHAEGSVDDGLRGQRGRVAPSGSALVIERSGEAIEQLGPGGQNGPSCLCGMHQEEPCERRLLIEELKHREQGRAHTIEPSVPGLEGHSRALGGERKSLLERRELAGFDALEMLGNRLGGDVTDTGEPGEGGPADSFGGRNEPPRALQLDPRWIGCCAPAARGPSRVIRAHEPQRPGRRGRVNGHQSSAQDASDSARPQL